MLASGGFPTTLQIERMTKKETTSNAGNSVRMDALCFGLRCAIFAGAY